MTTQCPFCQALADNAAIHAETCPDRSELKRQETCTERIAEHMAGRASSVAELQAVADSGREDGTDEFGYPLTADDAYERLAELPLSVEIVRSVKILLSTGGPADWLIAEIDSDGAVLRVEYHFADWFDHAETQVDTDSPLWRYAESVAELVADSESMYAGSSADAERMADARRRILHMGGYDR